MDHKSMQHPAHLIGNLSCQMDILLLHAVLLSSWAPEDWASVLAVLLHDQQPGVALPASSLWSLSHSEDRAFCGKKNTLQSWPWRQSSQYVHYSSHGDTLQITSIVFSPLLVPVLPLVKERAQLVPNALPSSVCWPLPVAQWPYSPISAGVVTCLSPPSRNFTGGDWVVVSWYLSLFSQMNPPYKGVTWWPSGAMQLVHKNISDHFSWFCLLLHYLIDSSNATLPLVVSTRLPSTISCILHICLIDGPRRPEELDRATTSGNKLTLKWEKAVDSVYLTKWWLFSPFRWRP